MEKATGYHPEPAAPPTADGASFAELKNAKLFYMYLINPSWQNLIHFKLKALGHCKALSFALKALGQVIFWLSITFPIINVAPIARL